MNIASIFAFFFRVKNIDNNYKKIYILGIRILSISTCDYYKVYRSFGFKFVKCKKLEPKLDEKDILYCNKKIYCYFDIGLGGGTESYFYNNKDILIKKYSILRVQYIVALNKYLLSFFDGEKKAYCLKSSLQDLNKFLVNIKFSKIILNNIVSWPDTYNVLYLINSLKNETNQISFRLHDFYAICPIFTLMRNNVFCNVPNIESCKNCYVEQKNNNLKFLDNNKNTIIEWRRNWGDFLLNSCDEVVVFSNSSKLILEKVYPFIKNKIKIIPHIVNPLKKVNIKEHKKINIGILGNITSIAKGSQIINNLEKIIHNRSDEISLYVIGRYKKHYTDTIVLGAYNRDELPNIVEKNNIDIIFIPSVCSETFSYTTSEAMLMEMPVACFNIGAPAERISEYKRGLILKKFDIEYILNNICNFVIQLRQKEKAL